MTLVYCQVHSIFISPANKSLKLDFEAQVNILKAENDQLKQKLQESKSDKELVRRITEIKDEWSSEVGALRSD